jgi:hypothetical protein
VSHEQELATPAGRMAERYFNRQCMRGHEWATFLTRQLDLHNHRQNHWPAPRFLEQEVRRGIS